MQWSTVRCLLLGEKESSERGALCVVFSLHCVTGGIWVKQSRLVMYRLLVGRYIIYYRTVTVGPKKRKKHQKIGTSRSIYCIFFFEVRLAQCVIYRCSTSQRGQRHDLAHSISYSYTIFQPPASLWTEKITRRKQLTAAPPSKTKHAAERKCVIIHLNAYQYINTTQHRETNTRVHMSPLPAPPASCFCSVLLSIS